MELPSSRKNNVNHIEDIIVVVGSTKLVEQSMRVSRLRRANLYSVRIVRTCLPSTTITRRTSYVVRCSWFRLLQKNNIYKHIACCIITVRGERVHVLHV